MVRGTRARGQPPRSLTRSAPSVAADDGDHPSRPLAITTVGLEKLLGSAAGAEVHTRDARGSDAAGREDRSCRGGEVDEAPVPVPRAPQVLGFRKSGAELGRDLGSDLEAAGADRGTDGGLEARAAA